MACFSWLRCLILASAKSDSKADGETNTGRGPETFKWRNPKAHPLYTLLPSRRSPVHTARAMLLSWTKTTWGLCSSFAKQWSLVAVAASRNTFLAISRASEAGMLSKQTWLSMLVHFSWKNGCLHHLFWTRRGRLELGGLGRQPHQMAEWSEKRLAYICTGFARSVISSKSIVFYPPGLSGVCFSKTYFPRRALKRTPKNGFAWRAKS